MYSTNMVYSQYTFYYSFSSTKCIIFPSNYILLMRRLWIIYPIERKPSEKDANVDDNTDDFFIYIMNLDSTNWSLTTNWVLVFFSIMACVPTRTQIWTQNFICQVIESVIIWDKCKTIMYVIYCVLNISFQIHVQLTFSIYSSTFSPYLGLDFHVVINILSLSFSRLIYALIIIFHEL